MLRQMILWLARSQRIKKLISTMPVSSGIVGHHVPGEDTGVRRARDRGADRSPAST